MRRLWTIGTILAVSSSALAAAKDEAQEACGSAAFRDYIAASLALDQSDPLRNSIETIMEQRRLTEAFCVRFVRCQNVSARVMATMVSKCIDDEDSEQGDGSK